MSQKEKLLIVKIGGKVLEDPAAVDRFAQIVAGLPHKTLIVHGGGRTATDLSKKLGLEIKMIEGRRITDKDTLEVATMVYAGLLNKKLVALLQSYGVDGLGLSGADLNTIKSFRREVKTIDYGFVGDIEIINSSRIHQLIESGITPAFCALTHDGKGQLLNTNADSIAAMLAEAMAPYYEVELYFGFELDGIYTDLEEENSKPLETISMDQFKQMKVSGQINLGMIPKVDNAFYAYLKGASKVFICNLESLADYPAIRGTEIC